jgi:hypothetical protein
LNGIIKNSYEPYLVLIVVFFHILIRDADLIIPWFEINLVKVLCPIELIQQIINVG